MQTAAVPAPTKSTNVRFFLLALQATFRTLGATSPALTARLATRLWATPPRAPLRPAQRAALDAAERFEVAAGDARVAAWAWGEGPQVLLVHGWGGHAGQLTPLAERLAASGLRAIAVDLPGHGATTGGEANLLRFAEAIAAVDRQVGGFDAVAAHSMGAPAVAWAMTVHLFRPRRAVFLAPAASMLEASRRFAAQLAISEPVRARMQRRFEERLGIGFDRFDLPAAAPALAAKLLVIHDEADREVPVEEGAAIAAAWQGAELVRTAGLGHHRLLRDETVLDRAAAFLAADWRMAR